MTIQCYSSVRSCGASFATLDYCGRPTNDPNSIINTAGYMSLSLDPDIEAATVFEKKNAAGEFCIRDRGVTRVKGAEGTLNVCGLPTHVLGMLTGGAFLLDPNDPTCLNGLVQPPVNYGGCRGNDQKESGFTILLYTENANRDICDENGVVLPFIEWIIPKAFDFFIGSSWSFQEEILDVELTFYAEENPHWEPPINAVNPFSAGEQLAIQQGGFMAYRGVQNLPDFDDCAYAV